MPVSPKQCVDTFEVSDSAELEKLQKEIDMKLLSLYHGQGKIVLVFYRSINERVRKRIIKNYTEAGWFSIEFKETAIQDQRDPSITTNITFTHAPSTNYFDR